MLSDHPVANLSLRQNPPLKPMSLPSTAQPTGATETRGAHSETRFGLTPPKGQPVPIRWEKFSKGTAELFKRWPLNVFVKIGEPTFLNLPLNDWMVRFYMIFGLYIPEAINATLQDRHKIETIGRNAIIWTGTLLLTLLTKHHKFSINALLDQFMKPKGTPYNLAKHELEIASDHIKELKGKIEKATGALKGQAKRDLRKNKRTLKSLERKETRLTAKLENLLAQHGGNEAKAKAYQGGRLHQWLNKIRLEYDYYEILKQPDVGIKVAKSDYRKAMWSSLSSIDIEKLIDRLQVLERENKGKGLGPKEAKELTALSKFLKRMNTFKLISTATLTALTVWIVGTVLMKLVFRYIAPLDHDFDPERVPQSLRKKIKSHPDAALHKTAQLAGNPFQKKQQPSAVGGTV